MKSATRSADRSEPLQLKLRRQVEAWRELVGLCVKKPSRKRVHDLRSATRRLEAALTFCLRQPAADPNVVRALARWARAGKKLRRALRAVRDADVYLARLGSLDKLGKAGAGQQIQLGRQGVREAARLRRALERRRRASEGDLADTLKARHKKWNRIGKEVEAALSTAAPSDTLTPAQAAFDHFAALSAQFPSLDSTNLHAYRKQLKHALYLTELAPADPVARKLRAAFRRIHNAAGEWHDWQALAAEAASVLGKKRNPDGVMAALEARAEAALRQALEHCRTAEQRLLKAGGK
jgi:hypothetical protein